MKCEECLRNLLDFVEGLLPHSEVDKIKEHLRHCDACRLNLEKIEKTLKILNEDKVPKLSDSRTGALFPLVMERIEERTLRIRKKRKLVYGFSFGFTLLLILFISVIGIQNRMQKDIYTFSFNPDRFVYESDDDVNTYLLKSLIESDTIITDIRIKVDEELVNKTNLTSLIYELSDEEIDQLVEKLKKTDFISML